MIFLGTMISIIFSYLTHPKVMIAKDKRALRQLATRFMICGVIIQMLS